MDIQLKKGALELCVLGQLLDQDLYGYNLVERITKHIDISDGTVYPILRRLEKEGLVESYLKESSEGPARRYYRINGQGKAHFESLFSDWRSLNHGVEEILRGDKNE
ncbi:MAG: PadR family transcriptional regulator [Spirochaetes bacterium GWF1_51_8]|nr:MAG: PadR family transcriptional regulator [Spirochaetes bacterium GWF1_51_8]